MQPTIDEQYITFRASAYLNNLRFTRFYAPPIFLCFVQSTAALIFVITMEVQYALGSKRFSREQINQCLSLILIAPFVFTSLIIVSYIITMILYTLIIDRRYPRHEVQFILHAFRDFICIILDRNNLNGLPINFLDGFPNELNELINNEYKIVANDLCNDDLLALIGHFRGKFLGNTSIHISKFHTSRAVTLRSIATELCAFRVLTELDIIDKDRRHILAIIIPILQDHFNPEHKNGFCRLPATLIARVLSYLALGSGDHQERLDRISNKKSVLTDYNAIRNTTLIEETVKLLQPESKLIRWFTNRKRHEVKTNDQQKYDLSVSRNFLKMTYSI